MTFDIIPDNRVRAIWFCTACGQYESVPPTFYQDSGTPVCCDLDMYYSHTRVLSYESLEEVANA
jgi:hypothetical protein